MLRAFERAQMLRCRSHTPDELIRIIKSAAERARKNDAVRLLEERLTELQKKKAELRRETDDSNRMSETEIDTQIALIDKKQRKTDDSNRISETEIDNQIAFIARAAQQAQIRSVFDGESTTATLIQTIQSMRSISLSGHALEDDDIKVLAAALHTEASLELIDSIPNRKPNQTENKRLLVTELNLENCNITDKGALEVAWMLEHNTTLQSLNLSSNPIGDAGATNIGQSLRYNSTLSTLMLVDCEIGTDGGEAISTVLPKTNLRTLDTRQNAIHGAAARQLSGAVLESPLEVFSSVKLRAIKEEDAVRVDLSSRGLGPTEALVMAGLIRGTRLKECNMVRNDITGEAAQELADAVLGSKTLEVFSTIPITGIRNNEHQELDFYNTGLGPTEAIVLATLIQESTTVTTLELPNNRICGSWHDRDRWGDAQMHGTYDPSGIKALADALAHSNLSRLDVSCNHIGPAGATALIEALQSSRTHGGEIRLTHLAVTHNNLNEDAHASLSSLVKNLEFDTNETADQECW